MTNRSSKVVTRTEIFQYVFTTKYSVIFHLQFVIMCVPQRATCSKFKATRALTLGSKGCVSSWKHGAH